MRQIRVTTVTLILSVACPAAQAGSAKSDQSNEARISILEVTPGKLSALDYQVVPERPGLSSWTGLYRDGDTWKWRTTQVRIGWAFDPFNQEDRPTGPWSGYHVSVVGEKQAPVVLVRGLPDLTSIEPKRAAYSTSAQLRRDDKSTLTLRLSEAKYTVKIEPLSGGPGTRCRLVLSSGNVRQILDTAGCNWDIVWAGDLDGDGKLDLLVRYPDDYSPELKLMLSSRAKPGELMRTVAVRKGWGE